MSTERGGGSCCLMSQRHCADSGGQGRPSRGKLYGTGGISNGEHIVLRIAFKPTSTIGKQQSTVNRSGEDISLRCPPWRAAHMVDSLVRPIFLFTRFGDVGMVTLIEAAAWCRLQCAHSSPAA